LDFFYSQLIKYKIEGTPDMRLGNKVAIVTGGGQGIGKGISIRFANEGAKVVIAQRTISRASKLAGEIRNNGNEAIAVGCDISKRGEVQNLISETLEKYGRVDILVNNASITDEPALAKFLEESDEHWNLIIGINLTGTFICCQEVARQMVKQGSGGRIINITSVDGFLAEERASAYCVSKAAVEMLSKTMALELAPYNITVNNIAPGIIPLKDGEPQQLDTSQIYERQPVRKQGLPEDIAAGAVYLAEDDAKFVSGASLLIDGGLLSYWFKYDQT
jgi:glucose 1-dehydrogenase